ncbi:hypothetical protein [Aphanothece hegewaldii]|uniref:hypothetical protein n=1 Tax=Aphanothece hegewaldii TaxID=1521625 RepID=UPI0015E7BD42|nr:hypothetical protein [Aphanothece hegewaldii]
MKRICIYLLIFLLSWTLESCSGGDRIETSPLSRSQPISSPISTTKLAEVAPPTAIAKLRRVMDQYEPQVTIISPKKNETFQENTVKVQIKVQDLPIFKDSELELGPHLTLILDNQPSQAIYDISEPVVLESLTPGTHTLRVFASRPWYESFKNDGAYDQTTFHIYTENGNNTLNPSQPLLTYNRPRGTYGAEPLLLDFYLTNAPLHVIAQENPDLADWRIKATINGESFLLDDWQSVYLKGFQKGENWVQLEFIDDKGNKIENNYNNTVRIITYDPDYNDSLTKLVKGEIPIEISKSIVDPNYVPQQPPEIITEPEPVAEEKPLPEIITEPEPVAEEKPLPEIITEPVKEKPLPEIITEPVKENETSPTEEPKSVIKEDEKQTLPEPIIEKEQPQINTEIPPVLELPQETLKPENTLPELIEQPTVAKSDETVPEIIINEPETVTKEVPEVIVPPQETPLEQEPPTAKKAKWFDKLLKPFPLQKGTSKTDTLPKEVEEPKTVSPEATLQPQPLPPTPEPSIDFNKPLQPQIEQPKIPQFDDVPRKPAIPKFI